MTHRRQARTRFVLHGAVVAAAMLLAVDSALALSELPEESVQPAPEVQMVPLPAPLPNPSNSPSSTVDPQAEPGEPDAEPESGPDESAPATEQQPGDDDVPVPPISYDLSVLPEPVRLTRERILEAAKSGDPGRLRALISTDADHPTQFSLAPMEGDPIEVLRSMSGDEQGQEILAILSEILEAGYVHMDVGTENEIYLWPYFFAVPIETLTPAQKVELFRLVTAGDYEDMKNFGAYIFYRTGIRPDGTWAFFVAGD